MNKEFILGIIILALLFIGEGVGRSIILLEQISKDIKEGKK